MRLSAIRYEDSPELVTHPHLDGVPRLYTTGDVAVALGFSQTHVQNEVSRGKLRPQFFHVHFRKGTWEPFLLFLEHEVDRYRAEAGSRLRPSRRPRQLNLWDRAVVQMPALEREN